MRPSKNQSGFGVIETTFVVVIVVLIATASFYAWQKNHATTIVNTPVIQPRQPCNKTCLDAAFQQVKIPGSFTLASKIWTYVGVSQTEVTPNAWVYTYSVPTAQFRQSIVDLHQAEADANYSLANLEAGPMIASSKKFNVEIIENVGPTSQIEDITSIKLTVKSP